MLALLVALFYFFLFLFLGTTISRIISSPQIDLIISHWRHYTENFNVDTPTFYKAVELCMESYGANDYKVSRVKHHEGNSITSPLRIYLRIQRNQYLFDICAAPYGNGYFLSWWMGERLHWFRKLIRAIPFIGEGIDEFFNPLTYYSVDTASMFQSVAKLSVEKVMKEVFTRKGVRMPNAEELNPFYADAFTRSIKK